MPQQQNESRSLLQLFDRHGRRLRGSLPATTGPWLARSTQAWRPARARMASATEGSPRTEIGNKRQPADPHQRIGGDRRQDIFRIGMGKHRQGDGMGRMKVDHRRGVAAAVVECGMKRQLLGRRPSTLARAVAVQAAKLGRIEEAERGIGRGHQKSAIGQSNADVSRRAGRQATLEQRAGKAADLLAAALSAVTGPLPRSGSPCHRSRWRRNCPI